MIIDYANVFQTKQYKLFDCPENNLSSELEECKPEESIKCPSFNASVFFKTAKEFFKESIFFIFMSNNFEF